MQQFTLNDSTFIFRHIVRITHLMHEYAKKTKTNDH